PGGSRRPGGYLRDARGVLWSGALGVAGSFPRRAGARARPRHSGPDRLAGRAGGGGAGGATGGARRGGGLIGRRTTTRWMRCEAVLVALVIAAPGQAGRSFIPIPEIILDPNEGTTLG